MNTLKKLEYYNLPENYSPKKLPDIIKLVRSIQEDNALIFEREKKPFLFETGRLVIRSFYEEDADAVQNLAVDKENSPMRERDHTWPTDPEGCLEAVRWFATQDTMWAVCLKPSMELIGMVTFNTVDENNMADLGHVWLTGYQREGLDTEALSLMVQYAFEKLKVDGVFAYNPIDYEPQIHPLKEIGMEITEKITASFIKDEAGNPVEFQAGKLIITRKSWEGKILY